MFTTFVQRGNFRVGYVVLLLVLLSAAAPAKPAPKTIAELARESQATQLREVGDIDGGPGFSARLYEYDSAGLRVYAMIAWPNAPMPESGYPVLMFNHGHHPNPPNYGISADGRNWRPGDYYRQIPELYAAKGFAVVIPDYRGHGDSEGREFTEGLLESAYYPEDVLYLLSGLSTVHGLDTNRVFAMGHSMGGEVTLRVLLATGKIRAASLWSTAGGDIWEQAYYYSRYKDPYAPDGNDVTKPVMAALREQLAELDGDFESTTIDPYRHLGRLETPVILHHAVGDRSTAYKWSERLAGKLAALEKPYQFWSYDGDKHLFDGCHLTLAVQRDLRWFKRFGANAALQ